MGSFEFCENGAKVVTWELTKRRVTREFFAAHTVCELEQESDHWLEEQRVHRYTGRGNARFHQTIE
jgi:hypothetical protein